MLALAHQSALIQGSRDRPTLLSNTFDLTSLLIAMQEGTIARLTEKGFGFIKREGQEKDLFFHSNELVGVSFDELREGDTLSFEVADSPKGPNAVKVSRA